MECLVFFSSRRRHTRFDCDWSSDVCSSDLVTVPDRFAAAVAQERQRIRSALELMRQVSLACEAHGITFLFPKAFQDYPDFGDDVDLLVLPRDRKSTRLNSSHSQISYAVFCLKKKKKLTTLKMSFTSHTIE